MKKTNLTKYVASAAIVVASIGGIFRPAQVEAASGFENVSFPASEVVSKPALDYRSWYDYDHDHCNTVVDAFKLLNDEWWTLEGKVRAMRYFDGYDTDLEVDSYVFDDITLAEKFLEKTYLKNCRVISEEVSDDAVTKMFIDKNGNVLSVSYPLIAEPESTEAETEPSTELSTEMPATEFEQKEAFEFPTWLQGRPDSGIGYEIGRRVAECFGTSAELLQGFIDGFNSVKR